MIQILFSTDQQEGTQSVVSQWLKKVGDAISENEPLVEVSTDKVNVEIAAPGSGVLTEILKNDGDEIAPGDVLGHIDPSAQTSRDRGTANESASSSTTGKPKQSTSRGGVETVSEAARELSPAVKRLVAEHNLDIARITGTGRGGRITHDDVVAYISAQASAGVQSTSSSPSVKSRTIPHTPMRRQIAHHMAQSLLHAAPHVTSVFEADLSAIIAHRERSKAAFETQGVKLTFTSYFISACVRALQAVPEVNSRYLDDALEVFEELNIGVATAIPPEHTGSSDSGLIVPVLRNAERLDLLGIARELQTLTEKARLGTLSKEDVRGGTFTISNHGVSGSLVATPIIINQPQSAILGIGKLERRPCVITEGGSEHVVIRSKAYVTLTIDHRVLDGFKANLFLRTFVECLEGSWG